MSNQNDYDQNVARDAGEAAGAAEGEYGRAEQGFDRDVQDVENAPANAARDVENIPSDVSGGLKDAANWVGDKFGGAENEGRKAEGDVNQFDQGVENSYDQGVPPSSYFVPTRATDVDSRNLYNCTARFGYNAQFKSVYAFMMGCASSKMMPKYRGRFRQGESHDRMGQYFAGAGDGGGWVGDTKPGHGGAMTTGWAGAGPVGAGAGGAGC